jgi:predicted glycogen debranching enzyme
MIKLSPRILADYHTASSREWLETNGIGGFASGTVSGANTRRYHGLLTAATRPPLGRVTMLSKFEETLLIGDNRYELSSNRFPGGVFPEGYKYLTEFRLDPFPIWTYEIEGHTLEKRIFMPHGMNATVCRWSVRNSSEHIVGLELRPLLSFVDYHHLQHENGDLDVDFLTSKNVVSIKPYDELPELFFNHNASAVTRTGYWYNDFEYAIEQERGFDFREDLFQPFLLKFDLAKPANVIVSTEQSKSSDAEKLEKAEIKRRKALIKQAGVKDDFAKQLVLAADQFIVKRGDGQTVIAGYPWFSDWGRDTMIALPGLTLATGRPEIAKSIILEFSKHISEGMLPNRFPDAGETPEYNTVDATLWYFEAIRTYAETTGDFAVVKDKLYAKLADIISWHLRGTRYNIHVDTDGLLYAGAAGHQLTWMDAKIGDLVITPRIGKPVEIQALWYNALRTMADFADRFGHAEDEIRFQAMADLARLSFNGVFWNEAERCLFDVVENGTRDGSVRPNQLFAISLHHAILDEGRWSVVVEKAQRELLTRVGLRSLSPNDPAYVPVYIGSPFNRDSAYHQGTVWGWLIGSFIDAYRRVYADDPELDEKISGFLSGFEKHLGETGLGQISEIFDADAPHNPRGCPAQAWSVAEVLRALREKAAE